MTGKLLSAQEAARRLGVAPATIWLAMSDGLLPRAIQDGKVLAPAEALDALAGQQLRRGPVRLSWLRSASFSRLDQH